MVIWVIKHKEMQGSDYYKSQAGICFWRDKGEYDWGLVCEGTLWSSWPNAVSCLEGRLYECLSYSKSLKCIFALCGFWYLYFIL